jgi:hypothetical protein
MWASPCAQLIFFLGGGLSRDHNPGPVIALKIKQVQSVPFESKDSIWIFTWSNFRNHTKDLPWGFSFSCNHADLRMKKWSEENPIVIFIRLDFWTDVIPAESMYALRKMTSVLTSTKPPKIEAKLKGMIWMKITA